MTMVHLNLDGRELEVESGKTILEVAHENGINIPTLCHDPRLKPYTACRICLVEVQGARGPVPSCAAQVTDGMVVKTQGNNISALRRLCLELLLSDHYGDCIAPCQLACPAGIDIQGFVALIANGQYEEAIKLIKESMPLPAICGRVCPRFCEKKCRRNLIDEPVAIMSLKRFVSDYDFSNRQYVPDVKSATGHKVAIIGGGPAGLSAAYYLTLEGCRVTIFDASPELGGMLRYGIPEYRLPKQLLNKEIDSIISLGIQVKLNTRFGQDFTIETLKNEGYEAIFIAIGAQASQKMRVKGEDIDGVIPGIKLLRDVILGRKVSIGQRVAVIGGGNTAMDAARTALRLGAKQVMIVYRRSRDEMPASVEEIEQAEQEGIEFHFLSAPVKIIGDSGKVTAVECVKMTLGEPDSSGRRRPIPVANSEFQISVDSVVSAIGQTLDSSSLPENSRMALESSGYIKIDRETTKTSVEGVFSGGDCATGPATVVEAVAAGHRAATSISQYLNHQPVVPSLKPFNCSKGELSEINPAEYAAKPRVPRTVIPALSPVERVGNFKEVEKGFTEEMAKGEAMRCLSCGCQDVFNCELKKLATEYKVNDKRFEGEKHHYLINDSHPYIVRDPSKCILCGSCLRICLEIQGIGAWSFIHRGFETIIQPSLGLPLQETLCESCHQCVSACPTGALTAKVLLAKPGPWRLKKVRSICPNGCIGCNLELGVKGNKVIEVTSPVGNVVNDGNLCRKGAFDYGFIQGKERLTTPLIKRNDKLVPTTWQKAFTIAVRGLKEIKEKYGGERLAILVSPKLTNEESYLAQKFARVVLGTNNIASTIPVPVNDVLKNIFGKNASTCSFNDIFSADLVLLFGTDLANDHPVMALKVRKAVDKGARLVVANSRVTRLDSLASMTLKVNPRTTTGLLWAMLNYILHYELIGSNSIKNRVTVIETLKKEASAYPLEKIAESLWIKPANVIDLTHLYIRAKNPVIIVDGDTISPSELELLGNLALLTGNTGRKGAGIVILRGYGNSQGQIDMGVSSEYLPGQESINSIQARQKLAGLWKNQIPEKKGKSTVEIIEGIGSGDVQGVLSVFAGKDSCEDSSFIGSGFSVIITPLLTEGMQKADVILPGTTFAETEGTFTSSERRVQRLYQAIPPLTGKQTYQIICELSAAMGYPMDYGSVSDIFNEITSVAPIYSGINYPEIPDGGVQWSVKIEESGSPDISHLVSVIG